MLDICALRSKCRLPQEKYACAENRASHIFEEMLLGFAQLGVTEKSDISKNAGRSNVLRTNERRAK